MKLVIERSSLVPSLVPRLFPSRARELLRAMTFDLPPLFYGGLKVITRNARRGEPGAGGKGHIILAMMKQTGNSTLQEHTFCVGLAIL